jgi:hypothetical protein
MTLRRGLTRPVRRTVSENFYAGVMSG